MSFAGAGAVALGSIRKVIQSCMLASVRVLLKWVVCKKTSLVLNKIDFLISNIAKLGILLGNAPKSTGQPP